MKTKLIFISLFFIISNSWAQDDGVSSAFLSSALEVLNKNAVHIKLTGDSTKNDKLTVILEDASEYMVAPLFDRVNEDADYVKNLNFNCHILFRGNAARCELQMIYKSKKSTELNYLVSLDHNKMPESIMDNRAELIRSK